MSIEIVGRKFGVVGLQRTGIAVATFLAKRGAQVLATDVKPLEQLPEEARALSGGAVQVWTGPDAHERLRECEIIIPSPGVPQTSPALQLAREHGITVIGEIELASQFCPGVFVAISGTKGKTTTTTLLGEMLRASEFPTIVAGNIGTALIGEIEQATDQHVVVAEVSSFQLETTREFRPHIGILLNIAPDHLDRHGSLDNYAAIKAKLFQNQDRSDCAILNADDENACKLLRQVSSRVVGYSVLRAVDQGLYVNGDKQLRSSIPRLEGTICARKDVALLGGHNVGNVLAASAAALLLGCPKEIIAEVIRTFRGVPNRLEPVLKCRGVLFVNDSQATTPFAVSRALEAFDHPIHLIAGGRAKVEVFDDLGRDIARHCASVTCIGESARQIAEASQKAGMADVRFADSLEQAMRTAFGRARSGDVILMSPACASFDMFRDYEHRGDVFRLTAAAIAGEVEPPEAS